MTNRSGAIQETERTYEFDEKAPMPDPSELLGASGRDPELVHLEAIYYDTADLRLLRAGITLCCREGGPDAGWHLKFPVDAESRQEIRLPHHGGDLPAEFVALTRLPSRGEPLSPVARLDTARRRWVLADTDGSELAELVEDRVAAHDLSSGRSAMQWCEVEVELGAAGRRDLLDRIEGELVKVGARRSTATSKLGRVSSELPGGADRTGPGRPDKRRRAGSAGAAVLDHLRERAEQIRLHDLGVRRDVPDAVHRMRVGAREMRSVLQGSGRVLDRSATRALAEELKWLGRELAPARDSEVLRERLVELVAELPAELVLGPVAAQVTREMAGRTRAGRERALAALDSDRYLRLHEMIDTLLADPPLTRRAARPARAELLRSIARAYRRTARRMKAALELEPGRDRDLALHEARKAAKRLRYVTELAAPSVGRKARRLRPALKRIHKLLGAHQDSVVARTVLRELAVEAHLEAADGFTYGLLHAGQTQQAVQAERELPAVWHQLAARISHGPFRV